MTENVYNLTITSKRSTKIKILRKGNFRIIIWLSIYLTLVQQISAEGLWILNFTKSFNLSSIVMAEINEEIESSLQMKNVMIRRGGKRIEKGQSPIIRHPKTGANW